ncbi:MAG TPA: 2-dehydro-3-deoxygalactonokinase [Fodinibius sp.]|nr:2-dehydro-3-deoxygalactonokinase [Fodinibius sp.]
MVASALDIKTEHIIPSFLSCDWGTSSFRLKLIESDTGKIVTAIKDDTGIKELFNRWSAYNGSLSRIEFYQDFLREKVDELEMNSPVAFNHPPIVLSGMASSSIGLKELSYSPLPFKLDDPALNSEIIEAGQRFPYALYLISGLRSSGDVMRGEETELLGLHAALHITDGLFLMAGTHSKHIVVENNAVIGFKTYMTGEFFDLISSKSILSNSVAMDRDAVPDRNFEKGVEEAQKENLLHSLFSIRARELILSSPDKSNNYAFLSGIVIGTELRDIGTTRPERIILWGAPRLQRYYAAALDVLGLPYVRPDLKEQKDITSLGQRTVLKQIYNY